MTLPREEQEGVACCRGRPRHPPGVMEDGGYFVTALFQVAQELVALCEDKEGVELLHPFSEQVSGTVE